MNTMNAEQRQKIQQLSPEKRYTYLLEQARSQQCLWILVDEHGCVMLNTEDEDCVPVWPDQAFAEAWATGEWQDCKAESIDLATWFKRWTPGLEQDQLAIVVFPQEDEQGLVIYPDELDHELRQQKP